MSSGIHDLVVFLCDFGVLHELLLSLLVYPLVSSFWDGFGSFLLPWIDQSHEWKLSTEGNPLIPHEIADPGNFSS